MMREMYLFEVKKPSESKVPWDYFKLKATIPAEPVSYTHLRAHETVLDLVCRLLLEKKKNTITQAHLLTKLDEVKQTII